MGEEAKKSDNNKKNNIIIPIIITSIVVLIIVIIIVIIKPFDKKDRDKGEKFASLDKNIQINSNKYENYIVITKVLKSGKTLDVFNYDCKLETCEIYVSNKGITIIDDNKLQYRQYTKDEVEKINNLNENINVEKLNMQGFNIIKEIANLKKSEIKYIDEDLTIYIVEDKAFVKKGSEINDKGFIINNILFYDNIVFNIDKKEVTYTREVGTTTNVLEEENVYVTKIFDNERGNLEDEIFNEKGELLVKSSSDKYYIEKNNIYYVNDNKVMITNEKNNIKEYDSSVIALGLKGELLLYLDKENNIMMKNIKNNKVFFTSDIKLENAESYVFMQEVDNTYQIVYNDESVINNSEFDKYLEKNIKDINTINAIKKCGLRNKNCDLYLPIIGYAIKIDKNGKLVSKEFALLG